MHVVHCYLGSETTKTSIRPVADLAVANPDDVRETIAGHVGEEDGLRGIGENERRAVLLVKRLRSRFGRTKAVLGQGRVLAKNVVFGNQDIGMAVSIEVKEFQIRITRVEVRERAECAEGFPTGLIRALVEAG